MIPVEFSRCNATYAKNQPEYLPLPAYRAPDGTVTTCWRLDWHERLHVLFGGRIWLKMLTFNKPLQPVLLSTTDPDPIAMARP